MPECALAFHTSGGAVHDVAVVEERRAVLVDVFRIHGVRVDGAVVLVVVLAAGRVVGLDVRRVDAEAGADIATIVTDGVCSREA